MLEKHKIYIFAYIFMYEEYLKKFNIYIIYISNLIYLINNLI